MKSTLTLRAKAHLQIGNLVEVWVVLVIGMNEMLNLSHRELANSEETSPRGNLVTESQADLSSCNKHNDAVDKSSECALTSKRHLATILLEETTEVDEHALGSLGTQEADLRWREKCWRIAQCI